MGLVITGLVVFFFAQLFAYFQKTTENQKVGLSNVFNKVILIVTMIGIIITYIDSCRTKNEKDIAQKDFKTFVPAGFSQQALNIITQLT